jgi:regulator of nonsense transcripts 1
MKGSTVVAIYTVGRETPTTSETLRRMIFLRILQRADNIMSHPFVRRIWLPSEKISWPAVSSLAPLTLSFPSKRSLNVSQKSAVNLVLSRKQKDRVALIHGPPGTGKTTVIAASVTSIMASASDEATIWLVAQSNVAVKNIAEKLMELEFTKFRILVSKDFHFEW